MSSATEVSDEIKSVHHNKEEIESKSLWQHAWDSLINDKIALISMIIVAFYIIVAISSGLGLVASDWGEEVGKSYAPPSSEHIMGTDIFGRSVFRKVIKGAELAMTVGFLSSLLSTFLGAVIGSVAGYFGGKIDEFIVWFYTTMSSIPSIMLLMGIALVLGKGVFSIIIALSVTSWVGLCRLIRAEVFRHKEREYVQAATSIGCGDFRKLFKHILPNVFHVVIINFSLQFITAIKAEVILSYIGLGVVDRPSWGTMISDARLELARDPMIWWGLAGATFAMFFIVLAFNLLGDALRDALDPKLKGK